LTGVVDRHELRRRDAPGDPASLKSDIDPFRRAEARVRNQIFAQHRADRVRRHAKIGRETGTATEANLAILDHESKLAISVPCNRIEPNRESAAADRQRRRYRAATPLRATGLKAKL